MTALRLTVLAGVVAVVAGCASTIQPQTEAEYTKSMDQARAALEQKGADNAVAQFEEIAKRNPSKGEPWSYIAKIRFDEQKYGEAIVAADETLNRDPQDFVAKTVRAVGGLRVALQSVSDLRGDALLAGNARPDAVALAAAMRETLGQDVLFPDGRKPPRGGGTRPPPKPKVDPDTRPSASATPAAAAAAPPPSVPTPPATKPADPAASSPNRAPNPFGDLLNK